MGGISFSRCGRLFHGRAALGHDHRRALTTFFWAGLD